MIKIMVTQAKMQDELFIETSIEPETFEQSLKSYIKTDPEIKT
jgi:hypothetical protein